MSPVTSRPECGRPMAGPLAIGLCLRLRLTATGDRLLEVIEGRRASSRRAGRSMDKRWLEPSGEARHDHDDRDLHGALHRHHTQIGSHPARDLLALDGRTAIINY